MYNFGVQPEICSMGVSIQVDVTHSVTCHATSRPWWEEAPRHPGHWLLPSQEPD